MLSQLLATLVLLTPPPSGGIPPSYYVDESQRVHFCFVEWTDGTTEVLDFCAGEERNSTTTSTPVESQSSPSGSLYPFSGLILVTDRDMGKLGAAYNNAFCMSLRSVTGEGNLIAAREAGLNAVRHKLRELTIDQQERLGESLYNGSFNGFSNINDQFDEFYPVYLTAKDCK